MSFSDPKQAFTIGAIATPLGPVPRISSALAWKDRLGTFKARWGIGRMNYTVEPGLYALGQPDERSFVLATANYKMSFDRLRAALPGRNVWILVLDTRGINVWCAAGKGTFGTSELVSRIKTSGLSQLVSHRQLILPQLSGPGVSAHEVKKFSGFKVIYGPIEARDLPEFLDKEFLATPKMRRKTFTTLERMVLIPIELVSALKGGLIMFAIFFLLTYVVNLKEGVTVAFYHSIFPGLAILIAILSGAILTPLLLPWLPGRAFSLKGLTMGLIAWAAVLAWRSSDLTTRADWIEMSAWLLIIPALSAFLAMNFTGCSTYTSLSGVKKEMRWAMPLEIGVGGLGFILWFGSRFLR